MCEYDLVALIMIKYASIYLQNRVLIMPEFWLCLRHNMPYVWWICVIHGMRSLYKLLSSYRDKYSEHCQAYKTQGFAKEIMKPGTTELR